VALWRANILNREDSHLFKPDIDFLILDGIPRSVEQAKILEQYIEVLQVFHLSLPNRQELYRRLRKRALKDNRLDDASDAVIEKRLKIYEDESKPLLAYYPREKITTLDASQHPAIVFHQLLGTILKLPRWQELSAQVY
jgi:adenylate kinase